MQPNVNTSLGWLKNCGTAVIITILISAFVAKIQIDNAREYALREQNKYELAIMAAKIDQAKMLEAKARYDASIDYKQKFLEKHSQCVKIKESLAKATRLIEQIKRKYNVSSSDILRFQLCTCPEDMPCWKGEPCDNSRCQACAMLKNKK